MRVHVAADIAEFEASAYPWLMRDEEENNFLISLLAGLRAHPGRFEANPLAWVIVDDAETVGVVLRSAAERPLVVSGLGSAACSAVAREMVDRGIEASGVFALRSTAEELARSLAALARCSWNLRRRLGLHVLTSVLEVPATTGAARPATLEDLPLLCGWHREFCREALDEREVSDPELFLLRRIRDGTVHVWDDGAPTAMVVASERTPNGVRVNSVYTPPEHRCHGYATSCVSAVCRGLIAAGRDYCALFTDLANPLANRIYPRIGFMYRSEYAEYKCRSLPLDLSPPP